MVDFTYDKVKRFWSNDALIKKHIDVDVISKISTLKQKCLSKVDTKEWNEKEYNDFVKFVNKIDLNRFSEYYDFISLYLDLPEEECHLELDLLRENNFVNKNVSIRSFPFLLASSVYDLQAQIYKLASIKLTEEEEKRFATMEERVEFYEKLKLEVDDPNSGYNEILLNTYNQFIESVINNPTLKQQFLDKSNMIITYKLNYLRFSVGNLNHSIERKNNAVANRQRRSTIEKCLIHKHTHRLDKRR